MLSAETIKINGVVARTCGCLLQGRTFVDRFKRGERDRAELRRTRNAVFGLAQQLHSLGMYTAFDNFLVLLEPTPEAVQTLTEIFSDSLKSACDALFRICFIDEGAGEEDGERIMRKLLHAESALAALERALQ